MSLTGWFHFRLNESDYYEQRTATTSGAWTYDGEGRLATATAGGTG